MQRFPFGYWETVELGGSRDRSNNIVRNALDNAVKNQKDFHPSTGAGQYLLKFSDTASGCIVTDSTGITVNGLPKIDIADLMKLILEKLKIMFKLFAEIMDRLCEIGSAYETRPEINLK